MKRETYHGEGIIVLKENLYMKMFMLFTKEGLEFKGMLYLDLSYESVLIMTGNKSGIPLDISPSLVNGIHFITCCHE